MNAKRRTGYGYFDISRQVARRIRTEWEMVESPDAPPPMRIPLEPPDLAAVHDAPAFTDRPLRRRVA